MSDVAAAASPRVLIVTDNAFVAEYGRELAERYAVTLVQSPTGELHDLPKLDVKAGAASLSKQYDLVISLHCRQVFPAALVSSVRCINVHPGYNPHHRGWFPHVFAMSFGGRCGVTIHEMDDQVDHGPIIVQEEVKVESWDTSDTVYRRLLETERRLLMANFEDLIHGRYVAHAPESEGNLNMRRDYEALKKLDLDTVGTFGSFLDRVRALSHRGFRNAYFIDGNGEKIYVSVTLERAAE